MNSCGAKAVFQAALTKWKFTILLLQWIINKAWNEITNKYQLIINPACPKLFWGLVKMTLMLVTSHVHAGYSLHEGQATKLTFLHHEIPQHTDLLLWLLIITVYTKYGDKSNERVHGIRPHVSVTKTQTLKTQTWDPEKLRPLKNSDPRFNIFQLLKMPAWEARAVSLSLSYPQNN